MNYSVKIVKKVVGKFEIEIPKNNWKYEFALLRSKVYPFKCGEDIKNK